MMRIMPGRDIVLEVAVAASVSIVAELVRLRVKHFGAILAG